MEDARRHSDAELDIAAIAVGAAGSGRTRDAYPGASIGLRELRDGERGKPLVLGKEGVTWQPLTKFATTPKPMGLRGDGVPTWLYSDSDDDGVVSAAESMETNDVRQGSVGNCYFVAALAAWSSTIRTWPKTPLLPPQLPVAPREAPTHFRRCDGSEGDLASCGGEGVREGGGFL